MMEELQPVKLILKLMVPNAHRGDELDRALDTIQNAALFSSQHEEEINFLVIIIQILPSCGKVENPRQETVASHFQKL